MICRRARTLRKRRLTALSCLLMVSAAAPHALAQRRLSLADAMALAKLNRSEAVEANIAIRLARVDVMRAALQRVQLTLDTSYTDGYQRQNIGIPTDICRSLGEQCNVPPHQQQLAITAALSVPVWSGMGVEAAWSRAQHLKSAAEARLLSASRSVALEAAMAYWAVRRAELLLEANAKGYERSVQVMQITKARTDAGIAPIVDYTRSRGAVLLQEATIVDLKGQAADARAQLAAALQLDQAIVLSEEPPEKPTALKALPDVLAEARAHRPELRAADETLVAQEQQVRIASAAFWPHVSLVGNADARNQLLGVQTPNLIASFSAGVQVKWLIFDSLSSYMTLRQEQLTAARLFEDRRRASYTVQADVQSAYERCNAAQQRRQPLREAVEVASYGLDIIRRRYQAGIALLIEVLQAEDELQRAELGVVNNSIDVAQSRVTLDAALGAL